MNKSRELYHIAANQDLSAFDARMLDIAFNAIRLDELNHVIENTKSRSVQDFALFQLGKFKQDEKWRIEKLKQKR